MGQLLTAIKSHIIQPRTTRLIKRMGIKAGHRGLRKEHVDLHIHSWHSDGFFSPTQLTIAANYLGLKAISLTDHDTFAGAEEMKEACSQFGIRFIPGIELTTEAKKVHFLGYHMTFKNPELLRRLNDIQEAKLETTRRSLGNLKKKGIELSESDMKRVFPQGVFSRPQLAEILRLKNKVPTLRRGIRLIGSLNMEYENQIEVPYFTLDEAVKLIQADGGVPIWAHPRTYAGRWEKLFKHFISEGLFGPEGLMGFEFVHGQDAPNDPIEFIPMIDTLREEVGINPILTNGSDYHDREKGKFGGVGLPWEVGRVRDIKELDEARKDKSSILLRCS